MRNVILLNGFWHGSWCWSLVTAQLAARGIPSVAVDAQGQGLKSRSPAARWSRPFDPDAFADEPSGVSSVTASTAAATLIEQIRVIGAGEPCVVVAHSMFGSVATLAAEREPSLFSHLIYVAAFATPSGLAAGEYMALQENEGEMGSALLRGNPFALRASRLDLGDSQLHAALREAFYADVDEDTANAAISLLNTDAPLGVAVEAFTVTSERYGSIPHTYVVCTQDNMIRPALQRRLVREIDAISSQATKVVELDSSHSPFLSQPAALADAIASAW